MLSFAVKPVILTAVLFSLALGPVASLGQDAFDLSIPEGGEVTATPANFECASESLSGSGPGFASSREKSEAEAVKAWLDKARAVYPEATWENAKDANLACAVQGLYSKCFADGIPCKPKG